MLTFALITEGKTDQYVIENILFGFFDDPDILIKDLIPIRDETDANREENYSNWLKVFEYCGSDKFKSAFDYNDYVIVQIDTDVSDEVNFEVSKYENGIELSVKQLIEKVKVKFIGIIGEEFFNEYEEKIIFAICVHSIECWLLPLYCDGKHRKKTKGCLDTLNRCLARRNESQISLGNKDVRKYEELSNDYSKYRKLMSLYKVNPSLEIFVEELITRFPKEENS